LNCELKDCSLTPVRCIAPTGQAEFSESAEKICKDHDLHHSFSPLSVRTISLTAFIRPGMQEFNDGEIWTIEVCDLC